MYIILNSGRLHDHALSNDLTHPKLLSIQTSMKLPSEETVVMSRGHHILAYVSTSVLFSIAWDNKNGAIWLQVTSGHQMT